MFGLKNLKQRVIEGTTSTTVADEETQQHLISQSFVWMGVQLLLAFGVSFGLQWLIAQGMLSAGTMMPLFRVGTLGGLGLIIWMSLRRNTMSYEKLSTLVVIRGILEGFGLSGIFVAYQIGTISNAFLSTSLLFLIFALIGYNTKIDIRKWGPILLIGLGAIILASIINLFLGSSQMEYVISIIGIVLFLGLLIYDMNVMKEMALTGDRRISLIMSVSLYLNFINIFLFILRLMGADD